MLNLLQTIVGTIQIIIGTLFRFVIILPVSLKFVFIIIIAQSLILFLFGTLLVMKEIANFLMFLLGEEVWTLNSENVDKKIMTTISKKKVSELIGWKINLI